MEAAELAPDLAHSLEELASVLRGHPDSTDALRAIQAVENVLGSVKADYALRLRDGLGYEDDGYSSATSWIRAELRVDTRTANDLLSAGQTQAQLPPVRAAMRRGEVSLEHVRHFSYGLAHVGVDATRSVLGHLLEVASQAEPVALRSAVRHLREAVFPDALDQAWIDGMAREDLQVNPVPDGWHVNGFLNSTTGAKLNTLLQSLSAPRGADDPRPSAQRRVDGLESLLDAVLNNGLPSDRGVRPHINITIDFDQLNKHDGAGELVGFGRIGIRQVAQLLCDAQITPVLLRSTDETVLDGTVLDGTVLDGTVLDVGRTSRLATTKQRTAIEVQQQHQCAAPGCNAPIIHIHHIVWWSHGGHTDLNNLIGLCPRCHRAVHTGTIV